MTIHLRDILDSDYPLFLDLHHDAVASRMAAFGTRDPDAATLAARWKRGVDAGTTTSRSILDDDSVIGFIASFVVGEERHITYWIARSHWGRGIATTALQTFLRIVTERPLHASTAHDNLGSQRVLEKCGFAKTRTERAFADARGEEVDEVFFVLG